MAINLEFHESLDRDIDQAKTICGTRFEDYFVPTTMPSTGGVVGARTIEHVCTINQAVGSVWRYSNSSIIPLGEGRFVEPVREHHWSQINVVIRSGWPVNNNSPEQSVGVLQTVVRMIPIGLVKVPKQITCKRQRTMLFRTVLRLSK